MPPASRERSGSLVPYRGKLPRRRLLFLSCLLLLLPLLPSTGSVRVGKSGLPLPRYASLASNRIHMRTGPGKQFPIRWIYVRAGIPVKIVAESEEWRQVVDPDGEKGWIHGNLLSSRHTVLVTGKRIRMLRRSPEVEARVLLKVEPGVIGDLVRCEANWCMVEITGVRGWMARDALWGDDLP